MRTFAPSFMKHTKGKVFCYPALEQRKQEGWLVGNLCDNARIHCRWDTYVANGSLHHKCSCHHSKHYRCTYICGVAEIEGNEYHLRWIYLCPGRSSYRLLLAVLSYYLYLYHLGFATEILSLVIFQL